MCLLSLRKRHKVVDWSYQNLIKKPDNRLPKFKHVGANANQIERITQDYQKIGEILEEQQISLNEIENVVRKSRQNENEKLDLLKKRIEYNVKKEATTHSHLFLVQRHLQNVVTVKRSICKHNVPCNSI